MISYGCLKLLNQCPLVAKFAMQYSLDLPSGNGHWRKQYLFSYIFYLKIKLMIMKIPYQKLILENPMSTFLKYSTWLILKSDTCIIIYFFVSVSPFSVL